MKKKSLGFLIGLVLVLAAVGAVFASQGNKFGRAVTPPFPQPAEKDLQKIIFIRYAPGFQKEKPCDYDGVCDPDEKGWCADCKGNGEGPTPTPTPAPEGSACYDFLAGSKPRWNWLEDYYYSESELGSISAWATAIWNAETPATIFGSGAFGTYPWGVYDLTNSVSYGQYSDPNVLAVTAIWFRGKNIYEYDIMLDEDFFPDGPYDQDTVALHEFGHGAGLNDLYDIVCKAEVMYGIYTNVKTALGDGDKVGIQTLYGP